MAEGAEEHFYVLDDDRRPRPVTEEEWWAWKNSDRSELGNVASTDLGHGYEVVTSFGGSVPDDEDTDEGPYLFHTLVLMPPPDDLDAGSYRTWEEAEAGHAEVVEHYRKQLEERLSSAR